LENTNRLSSSGLCTSLIAWCQGGSPGHMSFHFPWLQERPPPCGLYPNPPSFLPFW
jgi:hypothetical protein